MTASADIHVVRRDGERLDLIAADRLGTWRRGAVEQILHLNPGLAALPTILPLGTVIVLPPRPPDAPPRLTAARIWGGDA